MSQSFRQPSRYEPTWHSPADQYRLHNTMSYDDPLIPDPSYHSSAASNSLVIHPEVKRLQSKKKLPWLEIVGSGIGILGMLATIVLVGYQTSVSESILAIIAALFPMFVVVGTLVWIDRWEPEPKWLLLLAFLWGAGVATTLSLFANYAGQQYLTSYLPLGDSVESATATFVAPLIEETMKGLGVALILLANRKRINSPLDGVVIAGILAAGFAFTENVLYFARFADVLVIIFFMRAVLSPFVHTIFTSMTGLAIALGLTRSQNRWSWLWMLPIGWMSAVGLHGLWNGVASYMSQQFLPLYALFWLPLFITWLILNIIVSVKQRRWVVVGLEALVHAGWIHPMEARMLSSLPLRRIARRQSKRYGKRAKKAMADFQQKTTELALTYVTDLHTGRTEKEDRYFREQLEAMVAMRNKYDEAMQASQARYVLGVR
ncbi:MAG: PrsW family intramembrane metalloprotease [Actinomycetaceae bacterium]|nr:PrsW family intramembrane metalloprotease [Actinomycetaceae bacterium]